MSYLSDDILSESASDFEVVDLSDSRLLQEELGKIKAWLQPTDYDADTSELNRHLKSRAPGTGNWVCNTERYQQWRTSTHYGSLWVKGIPGAGKSVLAASTVEILRTYEDVDTPILYFFFRHAVLANRHLNSLLRDWLAQLLPYSIPLQRILLQCMAKGSIHDNSQDLLWDYLLKGIQSVPKVFCVVDAVDEMDTGGESSFLSHLNRLGTFNPAKVKLFMTSRQRQDLQRSFTATSILHINLEGERVGEDIKDFISYRLTQGSPLSEKNKSALAEDISQRSRGMFLYAKLLIDQILPELAGNDKVDINKFPNHLEEIYNQMLSSQAKAIKITTELQVSILGLITHASRPLRLRELAGYLHNEYAMGSAEQSKNVARMACYPLLEILEDETVQVIHHSFTEFLVDSSGSRSSKGVAQQFPILISSNVHMNLAISCIQTVVSTTKFLRATSEDPTLSTPFLPYARLNIIEHASACRETVDDNLVSAVESICLAENTQRPLDVSGAEYWVSLRGYECFETPLHFAARIGNNELARRNLATSPWPVYALGNPKQVIDIENTPFGLACLWGHAEIMKMIWNSHPGTIQGSYIPDTIVEAVLSHSYAVELDLLLQFGLRLNHSYSSYDSTSLLSLLRDTSLECFKLLLPQLSPEEVESIFCLCASSGSVEKIKIMMTQKGARATWKTELGTAMYQACASQNKVPEHVECIKLLLPSFPEINSRETIVRRREYGGASFQPEKERTLLHALAANWYDENHEVCAGMFDLLIKAGGHLESRDGSGDTPVLCLFPRSFNRSVRKPLQYLLQSGADANIRDWKGAALIHRALLRHLDVELIEILVQFGASVNTVWKKYQSDAPLPALALFWDDTDWNIPGNFLYEEGREFVEHNSKGEVAACLIRHGAVIDAGGDPIEVLGFALESCEVDTFALLLKARSERISIDQAMFLIEDFFLDSRDNSSKMKDRQPGSFIEVLLAEGVSTEVRNENGETPLLSCGHNNAVFRAFLEAGADKNARDNRGQGVLHRLLDENRVLFVGTNNTRLDRLRDLVAMGFDPHQVDDQGRSLLHLAMSLFVKPYSGVEIPFINQLIEYGISPRAKNNEGLTPVHSFFNPEREPSHNHYSQITMGLVEFLKNTNYGIDINDKDSRGFTPLHLAVVRCQDCSIADVHILVENGADSSILAPNNRNVLHLAARARNSAVVGYLADLNSDLINWRDHQGRTPLFDACVSGLVESVACLIRAGANIHVCDDQGWSPLHACAEFRTEQLEWTKNEEATLASQPMQIDQLRPYVTSLLKRERSTPYIKLDSSRGIPEWNSYLIENAEFAILSVTKALLANGADTSVRGGPQNLTPRERATLLDCKGMKLAFLYHDNMQNSYEDQNVSIPANAESTVKQEMLQEPWNSIDSLNAADLAWLKDHEANLFCALGTVNNNGAIQFTRRFSFMEGIALSGITEAMSHLGGLARRDETPDITEIDKWTLGVISQNPDLEIPPSTPYNALRSNFWKLEKISTVRDYLRQTHWVVPSLLYVACERVDPNFEMLRVLVETCGVDITIGRTFYHGDCDLGEVHRFSDIIHLLASTQRFWHLEAISYLVKNGLDVNELDSDGQTALHHACASSNLLSHRFVGLLLDLGANPHVKNSLGRSSICVVETSRALEALINRGVDISKEINQLLWRGIGTLNVDLVRIALDSGADVNRINPCPVYTFKDIDGEIGSSALSDSCPAVPLAGAFLYSDYTQIKMSPSGEDSRARLIRLLLQRGADPYKYFINFSNDDPKQKRESENVLIHSLFESVGCISQHLQILFEFPDKLDFNRRNKKNQTVFLAACNSTLTWVSAYAFEMETEATTHDIVDVHAEATWDSSGLFLKMLEYGADINALDKHGDNALHILLSNPSVQERHILEFLKLPSSHALILTKDSLGFTPLQLAFKILRPDTVNSLLSLGARFSEPPLDPDGYTPLHRIAMQCLTRRIASSKRYSRRLVPQPLNFLSECKNLWRLCIEFGMDVNAHDNTAEGNPPLFHYLSHHSNIETDYSSEFKHELTCHIDNFDDFFESADLTIKNFLGDGALHLVAWSQHNGYPWLRHCLSRPDKHDANVIQFLVHNKGLDPLVEDGKGRSCLDLAAEHGRQAILDAFRQKN